MAQFDILFGTAEKHYLLGQPLTLAERAVMKEHLLSSPLRNVAIACGALLRDNATPEEFKTSARRSLASLCAQLLPATKSHLRDVPQQLALNELSITLLLIPAEELRSDDYRPIIYALAAHERFTVRTNAMLLLGRLAEAGDLPAFSLLQAASQDYAEQVRNNAAIALSKIACKDGPPSATRIFG